MASGAAGDPSSAPLSGLRHSASAILGINCQRSRADGRQRRSEEKRNDGGLDGIRRYEYLAGSREEQRRTITDG